MNVTVKLIISLIAALLGNTCKKYYTDKNSPTISQGFIFNAIGSLTAALALMCLDGFGKISTFSVLLGILFGAVTAIQGITNICAIQIGPLSYTTVIISFSTIITALSGFLFFGESLGLSRIVGVILMLVSFVLATESKTSEEKKANLKWFILCIVAFISTGGIGIMQKVHQSSQYKDELNAFLIIAFVSSAVFCALFAFILNRYESKKGNVKNDRKKDSKAIILTLVIMLVFGICVALNNNLNLYLSGVMDSAVFFPVVNGGSLILTTLAAVFLFKERLSAKRWVGIAIGIASVIFLCNPFS